MRVILARQMGNEYVLRVHLDKTKTTPSGAPDPAWVYEVRYGADVPLATVQREAKALCAERLAALRAAMQAGPALALEGKAL